MPENNKKSKYFPNWFYIVAFAILGVWAIMVLFYAIGTFVNFLLLFLLVIVIILIVRGKKKETNSSASNE